MYSPSKKKRKFDKWILKAFVLAFVLTLVFATISDTVLLDAGWILAIVVIAVLMVVTVFFDMIGTAVMIADPVPFHAMASKRVKGARNALRVIKAQNMVTSICSDIIGDIGGILSGALGVGLAITLLSEKGAWYDPYLSIFVSACIASLTIALRAFVRGIAKKRSQKIVWRMGLMMIPFVSESKNKKGKKQKTRQVC
ncbi:MAG: hypothetical protein FWD76_01485 [Firmicutes bacterium]|nr:hypothetical protein [Bacillota bacterium]